MPNFNSIIKNWRFNSPFTPANPISSATAATTKSGQTNWDDDVAFKGEALLSFKVLLLELCAAAEGYDFVFADHDD